MGIRPSCQDNFALAPSCEASASPQVHRGSCFRVEKRQIYVLTFQKPWCTKKMHLHTLFTILATCPIPQKERGRYKHLIGNLHKS